MRTPIFFTDGQIPASIQDHTKRFQIHDVRQRNACWEASYTIDIFSMGAEFLSEYNKALIKDLALEAALATKVGFLYLLHASYRAWKERRPMTDTSFDRVEPVLCEVMGNGAPLVDLERERTAQRRILFERTDLSVAKMTAPIGRAALTLDIYCDDNLLDRHNRTHYAERDISAALLPLRGHREQRNLM